MGTFTGGRAALATRHGKRRVIAPALAVIGLEVEVADVDTDRFGTFTGEVDRPGPAVEVVLAKARAALEVSDAPFGLASEGTFAPHPELPGLTLCTELVAAVGRGTTTAVVGRAAAACALPTVEVGPDADLGRYCDRVRFPHQALVVRSDGRTGPVMIAKGITDRGDLEAAVLAAAAGGATVRVEPDLRAHRCPQRRPVIRAAAEDLARRLTTPCPTCGSPGFGLVGHRPGARCAACGGPTPVPAGEVHGCPACGHRTVHASAGEADPSRCPSCNP